MLVHLLKFMLSCVIAIALFSETIRRKIVISIAKFTESRMAGKFDYINTQRRGGAHWHLFSSLDNTSSP